ncbi:MAG: M28 family peptidase [Undibacterium sp.]|nr:M28 family peptidase [Undibacterium sp.]
MNKILRFTFTLGAWALSAGAMSFSSKLNNDPARSIRVDDYYTNLRAMFVAENAYQTVAFVEKAWRIAGNTQFNESIYHVEKILQQAGYKKESQGEADGTLTYRIESRKMKRPTWEPISASMRLLGEDEVLLNTQTNRNMMAVNSASTPPGGVSAEVVDVGQGGEADFTAKDLKGKIVFAENNAGALYARAIRHGAVGVLSYAMPAYTQPTTYVNSIQFQGIEYLGADRQKWAIALSYRAKEKLKAALAKGKTEVTVIVNSKIYEAEELTLVANVRGSQLPDERFVFSAHVQEPGANDNATGVGTLAEMARITAELVQQNKIAPQRTITFLWGDEIISTKRYIQDDPQRRSGIKWGMSLDMVGENTAKTGGSFLIEKMPDPSAIWTRGEDKHTEWGGSVLKESQLKPNYFTDFLLNRCRQQGKENGWVVNSNPYEGGSDHQPFLDANIPAVLMWHFTDVFYHTDADRLEMVSKAEMRNVGICALAAAYTLTQGDEMTALQVIKETEYAALDRLQKEYILSQQAIKAGADATEQAHIVDVWARWYQAALDKTTDIDAKGASKKIQARITLAKDLIAERNTRLQVLLRP